MFRCKARDFLWVTVDFGNPNSDYPNEVKRLEDLCCTKLVSDSGLLFNPNDIPKTLHSKLFLAALKNNRTLSVSKLMKFCPYEELILPLPALSTHWKTFIQDVKLENCIKRNDELAQTMLSTFFSIIKEGCKSSKISTVDLSLIPVSADIFYSHFLRHLKGFNMCKNNLKQYTLKLALSIHKEDKQLMDFFLKIMETVRCCGIHLILTGLDLHNCMIYEKTAIKILDLMDPISLLYLSLYFVRIEPTIESFLEKIKIFKNLRYLKLSYVLNLYKESALNVLSITLTELPQLSRLAINGRNLHNHIESLFKKHCKKYEVKKPKLACQSCCVIHNGKLEYLDISSSELSDEDIVSIRDIFNTNPLKYLDLGSNSFKNFHTMNILTPLKTSLMMLDLSYAFPRKIFYEVEAFPFSQFNHLKYLNLDKVVMDESSKSEFEKEKSRALNLFIHP